MPGNQSGKQSGDCFPDWFQGTSLGSCSRQLPRQLPKQVSRILLQDVPNRSRTSKTPIPGNRWFGTSWDGLGRLGAQFLIVYILVSSKPALQNPVILVFGQGVAKTARKTANSGQFSATFYGLFRNLTFSHFSRSGACLEQVPGKPLQDVSRTCSGRVSGRGVWSSFPGAAPDCSRLPPSLVAVWWQVGVTLGRLAKVTLTCHPDWCHGLESATNQTTPGASPCCQVGKSAQVTPTWFPGWGGLRRLAKKSSRVLR